jgi:hypothetical protein
MNEATSSPCAAVEKRFVRDAFTESDGGVFCCFVGVWYNERGADCLDDQIGLPQYPSPAWLLADIL